MVKAIRVELHAHSDYSPDGAIGFDALIRWARRRGLDAVAITDHDTLEGARDYRRMARRLGAPVEILVGEERTLEDGRHLIGLLLEEPLAAATFEEALAEIAGQGGLAVLPHPFRPDGAAAVLGQGPVRAAFEIFNPKCSAAENRAARSLLERGLTPVGGSDAHYASELGESVNLIAWRGDVEASLREALAGGGPERVLGIVQAEGPGRRYAPLYYRLRPWLPLPRALRPAARRLYARWREWVLRKPRALEEKYGHGVGVA